MKQGETARYYCPDCNREFEVCLEPKYRNTPGMGVGKDEKANHCPFCGQGAVITEDEDETDEN